jgi:CheY-like chemotaxis protein
MKVSSHQPAQPAVTILIVEDEILIRMDLADYLRECGYQVIEASNADEAMAVFQSGRQVGIALSDIQMPGSMDGFGLTRWIRANRPDTKVILTSGVTRSTELAADLCEHGPIEAKPYDHQHLADRIRRSLAEARRAGREPSETRSFRAG